MDWKRKLSSRKFWAAVLAVVTALCTLFGVPDLTVEKVLALVSACAVLVGYIFAESFLDAKAETKGNEQEKTEEDAEEESLGE